MNMQESKECSKKREDKIEKISEETKNRKKLMILIKIFLRLEDRNKNKKKVNQLKIL